VEAAQMTGPHDSGSNGARGWIHGPAQLG
jgi:hypothetical protein